MKEESNKKKHKEWKETKNGRRERQKKKKYLQIYTAVCTDIPIFFVEIWYTSRKVIGLASID